MVLNLKYKNLLKLEVLITLSIVILHSCSVQMPIEEKIKGVSFVASRDAIDSTHTKPVSQLNANYAAVMPFGFIRDLSNPEIIHNTNRQWYGETRAGTEQYIESLRKHDIKIMMKPQIWVGRGLFTGFIKMDNENDWTILENSYSDFIMEYANLAEETNCEILCIGTELENFINERPDYWMQLINKIKKVYSGKLTYAANWDEFKRTPFWEQLDYIGIDAYFPVSSSQTPSVEECLKGWNDHKSTIKDISQKYKRPIIFTEFGYRSVDFAGREPWKSDREMNVVNLEAQENTTKALFDTFWHEPWFAGGFVWKWFHRHEEVGGNENHQFTPQNKPAEDVIRLFYSKS